MKLSAKRTGLLEKRTHARPTWSCAMVDIHLVCLTVFAITGRNPRIRANKSVEERNCRT